MVQYRVVEVGAVHVPSEVVPFTSGPVSAPGCGAKRFPRGRGTVINVPGETKWRDKKKGCSKCVVFISSCCKYVYRFIVRGIVLTGGLYISRVRGNMGNYCLGEIAMG